MGEDPLPPFHPQLYLHGARAYRSCPVSFASASRPKRYFRFHAIAEAENQCTSSASLDSLARGARVRWL